MRRVLMCIALIATALMLGACGGQTDEFFFTGRPIAAEMCSGTQMAYLIEVIEPEGVGDTVTVNGKLHRNVVMGYRASRLLVDGETLYGVAYATRDYAALNCMTAYNLGLPELILVSVDEDSARVMQHLHQSEE